MAEFKIILSADTKGAQTGINQVVQSVESLRKKYITGKGSLEGYNQALNDQLAHNNEMLTPLKALETNYKLVHQELSRMTIAFGENNDIVKELGNAYERAGQQLADYKAKLASNNADASLKDESAKIQAQLEAEQKAIDDSRTYYKALGDSMGYAENEANILNNALKKTISAGGSETAINDAASAYLKQKDAIAEVARQEELYLAQVKNAISQEKAREQAIEDANNASLESWKRYTDFVAQQQTKLDSLNAGSSPTESSMKMGDYSSSNANMNYYKAIGDNVGYAKEEVALYSNEIKRLLSLEGDHTEELNTAIASYKNAQSVLESMNKTTTKHGLKLLEITKNILKFQLILGPIRQALRFVTSTLSESVTVAAEAEQVFNKLATVFDGVESSANSMATSLASSLGVANSTAASALSTVADMLQAQGMGTTESLEKASEWVSKFQDIIAFKDINMDLEEFAQNFMSGATGNLRNFRTFGSIVKESAVQAELAKEGLSDLSEEEENLAKMVTRAEMALEQQANAMGATESEWNTTLSVTNRLNEQWKQWKENLGDVINTALTPMKSWLSDILSEANQVTNAMKEINSGEFTIKYESVASDDAIKKLFTTTVGAREDGKSASSSGFLENWRQRLVEATTMQYAPVGQTDYSTLYAEDVASIALATGASLKKIKEILESTGGIVERGYALEDNIWEKAQEIFDEEERRIQHKNEQDKQLAKLQESAIQDYQDSVRAMFGNDDSLASWLSGNSFVDKTSADYLVGGNTGTMGKNVDTAISDLSEALSYINNYLPIMESELSDLQIQLLDAYDALNSAEANGWSDEEIKAQQELIVAIQKQEAEYEKTISLWTGYQSDLTDALKDLYTQSAYDTALSTQTGNTADYQKQYDQLRMTDNQKALDDLKRAFDEIDTSLFSDEQIIALNAAYEESRQALVKLQEETAKYNAELEEEAKLKEYNENTADYEKQLRQLGMTDFEKTVEDMVSQMNGDEEHDAALQRQISAYSNLYAAQEKYEHELERSNELQEKINSNLDSMYSLLGDIGTVLQTMNSWTAEDIKEFFSSDDKSNTIIGQDITTLLLNFASQLEVVQKISSFVGDYIIPVLDSFLEPLLPLIETIGGLAQSILQGILAPLFPFIVEICAVLTLIIGTIKAGIDFIVNSIKAVIGGLAKAVLRALDELIIGDQSGWYDSSTWVGQWAACDPVKAFQKTMDETLASVEKIRGTTLDIKDNTEEEVDLSFLNELLKAGVITESQYNERAKVKQSGLYWDTVKTGKSNYMDWSNTGTSVRYGNVTVNISGGDQAEVKRTILRAFSEVGLSVQGAGFGEAS